MLLVGIVSWLLGMRSGTVVLAEDEQHVRSCHRDRSLILLAPWRYQLVCECVRASKTYHVVCVCVLCCMGATSTSMYLHYPGQS